jgi:hypothetical protein
MSIPQPCVDSEPGDGKRISARECFLVSTGDCDLFSMMIGLWIYQLHCLCLDKLCDDDGIQFVANV